jgi:hypothetical protein
VPYVGDKGGHAYPAIKRAKLIAGEDWMAQATLGYTVLPQNAGGVHIELEKRETWSHHGHADLSSTNAYGFTSRSQFLFPEAYKPVDTKFWQPLTEEETLDIHARQAAANLKATFQNDEGRAVANTEADEQYAEATGRRNQALRRRRKPMNYDERKKHAEALRKLPLVRRYATGESAFRESSAIVKTGPLDTPVLVSGMPADPKKTLPTGPAPPKLKIKRNRRRAANASFDDGETKNPYAEISLPTFDPASARKAKLLGFRNSWGLPSRSEMMYPEAYKDMSTVYWKRMSDEDQQRVTIVQARAMEKAGYERGTDKRFIEEIEPDSGYVFKGAGRMDDTNRTRSGSNAEFIAVLFAILTIVAIAAYYGWRATDDAISTSPRPQPQVSVPSFEDE